MNNYLVKLSGQSDDKWLSVNTTDVYSACWLFIECIGLQSSMPVLFDVKFGEKVEKIVY